MEKQNHLIGKMSGNVHFSRYLQSGNIRPVEDEKTYPAMYDTQTSFSIQKHYYSDEPNVNPFHLEISQPLTSLSSAMPEEVRHDVLNALKNGKAQK